MSKALFGSASLSLPRYLAIGGYQAMQAEERPHARLPMRGWFVIAGMFLASCATIVEGSDQTMVVKTEPSQASCTLIQEGNKVAEIRSTPRTVTLEKSKEDLSVECTKEGYFKETASVTSTVEGMTFGNIIFGGIIGVGIDAASGAMHHYPNEVTVLLTPTSFESAKARGEFFSIRREYLVSETKLSTSKIRKECLPELKADCDEEIDELEQVLNARLEVVESQRANAKIDPIAAQAIRVGAPNSRRIIDRETFQREVVGRPLKHSVRDVRIVAQPNGTISGSQGRDEISGKWEFRDGYYCRSLLVGSSLGLKDCQVVYLDENGITLIRQRGRGDRVKYQFAKKSTE